MLKQVTIQDLELLYHIETTCFPIQEAASYQSLKERLTVYHEGFEIFYIDHQAIGYIGGLRNHECNLPDSMYENAFLHQENGKYQMIFQSAFYLNIEDMVMLENGKGICREKKK